MNYENKTLEELCTDYGILEKMQQPERYSYSKSFDRKPLLANEFGVWYGEKGKKKEDATVRKGAHVYTVKKSCTNHAELISYLSSTGDSFNNISYIRKVDDKEDPYKLVAANAELFKVEFAGASASENRIKSKATAVGTGILGLDFDANIKTSVTWDTGGTLDFGYKRNTVNQLRENVTSSETFVILTITDAGDEGIAIRFSVHRTYDSQTVEQNMVYGFEYLLGEKTVPESNIEILKSITNIELVGGNSSGTFKVIEEELVGVKLYSSSNVVGKGIREMTTNKSMPTYYYEKDTNEASDSIASEYISDESLLTICMKPGSTEYLEVYKIIPISEETSMATDVYVSTGFRPGASTFDKKLFLKHPLRSPNDDYWLLPNMKQMYHKRDNNYFYIDLWNWRRNDNEIGVYRDQPHSFGPYMFKIFTGSTDSSPANNSGTEPDQYVKKWYWAYGPQTGRETIQLISEYTNTYTLYGEITTTALTFSTSSSQNCASTSSGTTDCISVMHYSPNTSQKNGMVFSYNNQKANYIYNKGTQVQENDEDAISNFSTSIAAPVTSSNLAQFNEELEKIEIIKNVFEFVFNSVEFDPSAVQSSKCVTNDMWQYGPTWHKWTSANDGIVGMRMAYFKGGEMKVVEMRLKLYSNKSPFNQSSFPGTHIVDLTTDQKLFARGNAEYEITSPAEDLIESIEVEATISNSVIENGVINFEINTSSLSEGIREIDLEIKDIKTGEVI